MCHDPLCQARVGARARRFAAHHGAQHLPTLPHDAGYMSEHRSRSSSSLDGAEASIYVPSSRRVASAALSGRLGSGDEFGGATMHWWNASWLASLDGRRAEERAAHAAAIAILEDHAATGRPFALFLHAFSSRQYYGQDPDGNGGMLLDAYLDGTLQKIGARMIKVQDPAGDLSFFVPGLLLENATWLLAVRALMARAELIVSECSVLHPGVLAELQAFADLKKFDLTVLILPSPPLEFVGNEDDVQVFARAIHQHELIAENPARTFVFRDLIERIEQIGKIAPARRLELIENGRLDDEVRVSFRGVPEGLVKLTKEYAREEKVGAAYFSGSRAVKVAELASPSRNPCGSNCASPITTAKPGISAWRSPSSTRSKRPWPRRVRRSIPGRASA
jgi:hypothetical protein